MNIKIRGRKLICEQCQCKFIASRSDTKYCSGRCRYAAHKEEAHFKYHNQPNRQSGIPNIRWHRTSHFWCVYVKVPGRKYPKYVGSRRTIEQAVEMQKRALNDLNSIGSAARTNDLRVYNAGTFIHA